MMTVTPGIAETDYLQKVRDPFSSTPRWYQHPRVLPGPTELEDDIDACQDEQADMTADIEQQQANREDAEREYEENQAEAQRRYQDAVEQASASDVSKEAQTRGNTDSNPTGNNPSFDGLAKAFDQAFQNALDGTVAPDAFDQAFQNAFDKALQEAQATGSDNTNSTGNAADSGGLLAALAALATAAVGAIGSALGAGDSTANAGETPGSENPDENKDLTWWQELCRAIQQGIDNTLNYGWPLGGMGGTGLGDVKFPSENELARRLDISPNEIHDVKKDINTSSRFSLECDISSPT